MKKSISILLGFLFSLSLTAQSLTIEEATLAQGRQFAPKTWVTNQFRKNTNDIVHLSDDYQQLILRKSPQWQSEVWASKSDLETALKTAITNDEFSLRFFPYTFTWISTNEIAFDIVGKKNNYNIVFDIPNKKVTHYNAYPLSAGQVFASENQKYVAYTQDNNIYITSNGNAVAVTNDTDTGIVNGSDYVHRQEFGIDKGIWWSPTSDKLLYYRKDETMVGNYPLPQWNDREATNKDIKYPMAGMKSEEVTLVVYDITTQQKITLQTGEPKEQYLTSVTWCPAGKSIFVGILNREQNHLILKQYNAQTGALMQTLFEEKASTYVEPLNPLTFVPNTENFLYQTEKEGYTQLYLYNTKGKLIKKLGYQDVVVINLLGLDSQGKNAFYVGATNNGLDRQLYKVNLSSGKTEILTNGSGVHRTSVSTDGNYLLDNFNNTQTPNEIKLINTKTKKSETLLTATDPYQGKITLPKMELVTLTAADGKTPLNGRIIYPTNFNPAQQYPVIVYVYGGPHAQMITNSWLGGASLFDYYLAQQGYIVFTLDNRGSDARGKDFEHVIHRQMGQAEMADQVKGIEFLTSKPFVNPNKIGVSGWSYGGYMTISLLLNHSNLFKVGVAGGPVCDWKYYEIMYGERYMDTPQENPEGYTKTSLLNKANQLNGRLLIIHGAQDPVVVQQHSMNFIQACIENNKQVDYFLYPNHEHNVRGKERVHLNQKIADYFNIHLK